MNSLIAHPEVLSWEPDDVHVDCWALQEVQVAERDTRVCHGMAEHRGRRLVLGPPAKPNERGHLREKKRGGVTVSCDSIFPAERCWDYDDGATARLKSTSRFVHVWVHVDKARCINVCSIYAHVDQTNDHENVICKRECLFRDAFEYLASLSDAPTLLMGDFNTLVEDSEVLSGALSTGDWIDLAARFSKTDPTCRGKHGRRKTWFSPMRRWQAWREASAPRGVHRWRPTSRSWCNLTSETGRRGLGPSTSHERSLRATRIGSRTRRRGRQSGHRRQCGKPWRARISMSTGR